MTRAEVQALAAAGIPVVVVYQTTAGWMLDGLDRGGQAAQEALTVATDCGMPFGRPIYYALDTDPRALTATQWTQVERCLVGAAAVTGRARVGIYGGLAAIERLVPTFATFGWQTYAWSGGVWSDKARLRQYKNNVQLCGGAVDLNRALGDVGEWRPV